MSCNIFGRIDLLKSESAQMIGFLSSKIRISIFKQKDLGCNSLLSFSALASFFVRMSNYAQVVPYVVGSHTDTTIGEHILVGSGQSVIRPRCMQFHRNFKFYVSRKLLRKLPQRVRSRHWWLNPPSQKTCWTTRLVPHQALVTPQYM